jgi:hypothetical protein
MVEDLAIRAGGIYAATAAGLRRYGETPEPPEALARTGYEEAFITLFTRPSGRQVLILFVTVVGGVWVLAGSGVFRLWRGVKG